MPLAPQLLATAEQAGARLRVGYPWWLRPWLARGVVAITLGRWVFLRPDLEERSGEWVERLIRHELAHVRQVNRYGLPLFLGKYLWDFGRNLIRLRSFDGAYHEIPFEIEARAAEQEETGPGL